jgi:hypothetical protein
MNFHDLSKLVEFQMPFGAFYSSRIYNFEQIFQPTNHVQLKQNLHNKINAMGQYVLVSLHVRSIIQLIFLDSSNPNILKNFHIVKFKTNELKGY